MVSRDGSIGFASVFAGVLVFGIGSLPAAWGQDAQPPAGYPPVVEPTDSGGSPSGNYAPPPAEGAQPQYTPAIQQPAAPPPRSPFLALPFIGIHSIQNSDSNTGPGLRIGGIIGARLNDQVSFNGELVYDRVNLDDVPSGADVSVYNFQAVAAPFFHLQIAPTAEIVIGPKVGLFHFADTLSAYGTSASSSVTGWIVGGNLGAFVRVSNAVALGGLVSFDYEKASICSSDAPEYDGDTCSTDGPGLKLLSFAAGALF